jgi:hypothetical protein
MKKILLGLAVLALATPVMAQDNVSGSAAPSGDVNVLFRSITASNNYFAARYICKDSTASSFSVQVADCCIAGDQWRAMLQKGNTASRFGYTGNLSQFTPGAAAFAPDVYSPAVTFTGAIGTLAGLETFFMIGNSTPGGLPAGGTGRISSNGFDVKCAKKQVVNGSAQ